MSALGKFAYPTGRKGAIALGYDHALIEAAHPDLLGSFCGVGNPFSAGPIRRGERVLDFGCGAGFDLFVAAALVGTSGRICGTDLTERMLERARTNLVHASVTNFELRKTECEIIPYPEDSFDVVVSNGVINLCPDKKTCFQEFHRVLKPGGRLQFADVMLEQELPRGLAGSPEAWSQ